MKIHEITFSDQSLMKASLSTAQEPLILESTTSGLSLAILLFYVIDPTSCEKLNFHQNRINHLSVEFQSLSPELVNFHSKTTVQNLEMIGSRQPRVEYIPLQDETFMGARHLFVAYFSKSFFTHMEVNDEFLKRLFGRIYFDIEQFQINTLIMDQLVLPDTVEYYRWNSFLRNGELWKNSLENHLSSVLSDTLIVCPKGTVWNHYLNQCKTTTTVMSYNVLAQSYTSTHYNYCKQYIGFNVRTPKIVKMVDSIQADIQMYQEMEKDMLNHLTKPHHHVLYKPKEGRKEGLAIIVDKHVWEVTKEGNHKLALQHPQEMIFVALKHRFTQKTLLVVCTHLIGDPNLIDIQTEQANVLASWSTMAMLQCGCENVVIGGDFNADQTSQAYQVLEKTGFKSAIKEIHGKEPNLTFNTDKIHRAIDFLWFNNFKPLTSTFNQQQFEIKVEEALPNNEHGSDHIPIFAKFNLN